MKAGHFLLCWIWPACFCRRNRALLPRSGHMRPTPAATSAPVLCAGHFARQRAAAGRHSRLGQTVASTRNAPAGQASGAFCFQRHEHFLGQCRHPRRAWVMQLHRHRIAAAAVDHPAGRTRPGRRDGESRRQKRPLFKSVTVSTDKGSKDLYLRITILPPVIPILTDAERANGVAIAKADRQAIFKADCATCHVKARRRQIRQDALRRRLRHLPRGEKPRRSGAGFAQPENADQRRILAHLDRPRQARLAHARVRHRRRRPAQRHANRHAGRLSEHRRSPRMPTNAGAGKLTPTCCACGNIPRGMLSTMTAKLVDAKNHGRISDARRKSFGRRTNFPRRGAVAHQPRIVRRYSGFAVVGEPHPRKIQGQQDSPLLHRQRQGRRVLRKIAASARNRRITRPARRATASLIPNPSPKPPRRRTKMASPPSASSLRGRA